MIVQKHAETKENAVSPVVGVMLMLVVTIVIAAVVAVFATGIAANTEPASIATIKLTGIDYGTINQVKQNPNLEKSPYVPDPNSFVTGYTSSYGENGNYAPYRMAFKLVAGDRLDVSELKLVTTVDNASYSVLFSQVTNAQNWIAGETITLLVDKNYVTTHTGDDLLYGLTRQNCSKSDNFTWSIVDGSGMVIAKGVETVNKNTTVRLDEFKISSGSVSINGTGFDTVTISNPVDQLGNSIPTGVTYTVKSTDTSKATASMSSETTVTITGVAAGSCKVLITGTYGGASVTKEVSVTVTAAAPVTPVDQGGDQNPVE